MNALADFILTLGIILGPLALVLALLLVVVEFAQYHRYEIKWCWRLTNWLDSL